MSDAKKPSPKKNEGHEEAFKRIRKETNRDTVKAFLGVLGLVLLLFALLVLLDSCTSKKAGNKECYKFEVTQFSGIHSATYYADSVAWESDRRFSLWSEEGKLILEKRIEAHHNVEKELSDCYKEKQ